MWWLAARFVKVRSIPMRRRPPTEQPRCLRDVSVGRWGVVSQAYFFFQGFAVQPFPLSFAWRGKGSVPRM